MKKICALMTSLLMFISSVSVFAEDMAPKWINSNIIGSVTADMETSPRDDFHLYVNKDWLATAVIPEGMTSITAIAAIDVTVRQQVLSLLKGDEQASYEGKLVQQFFKAYNDIDARNAAGMSPVLPMIEAIRSIKTLDELTAYCLGDGKLYNPLYSAYTQADIMDSSRNCVYIQGSIYLIGDADEYKSMTSVGERYKQAYTSMLEKLLVRVGYSQQEAAATLESLFDIEGQIASVSDGSEAFKQVDYDEKSYNPVTIAELDELSPVFPLTVFLKDFIDAGVERFIIRDKNWLAKMNEVYTQENLDGFKAMLLCETLMYALPYLDKTCMDLSDEAESIISGMEVHSVLENEAYNRCNDLLGMAIGRMYCENYVSVETKENIEKLIADVVAVYKKRLTENTWLGEETRQKAIEKLDNLSVHVAYPDDWSAYDVSDITFQENGTLIDYTLSIDQHNYLQQIADSQKPVDKEKWHMTPHTVNAYYSGNDNAINILSGILAGDVFYSPDASFEAVLGGIGVVIAHEITHGFDSHGSQFDKNGNMASWWTDADRAAFNERTSKVEAFYNAIEMLPGKFCDGKLTIGETVADLGAVSCVLEMAREIDNFDYNTFFTTYANIWKQHEPVEVMEYLLRTNVHTQGYLRTNANVQQFQEFYDTYGVVQGDGMYLPVERRLSVW